MSASALGGVPPSHAVSLRTMAAAARALAEGLAERMQLTLALDAEALAQRIDEAADDEPTAQHHLPRDPR